MGYWNDNGLSEDKLCDDTFIDIVKSLDIVLVSESKLTAAKINNIQVDKYYVCSSPGQKKQIQGAPIR